MGLTITRWHSDVPAAEAEVKQEVKESGLEVMRWEGESHKPYAPHRHGRTKTLWCAKGEIVFHVNGNDIILRAGDQMILPSGTVHSADAGPDGVVCYESPPLHENTTIHE